MKSSDLRADANGCAAGSPGSVNVYQSRNASARHAAVHAQIVSLRNLVFLSFLTVITASQLMHALRGIPYEAAAVRILLRAPAIETRTAKPVPPNTAELESRMSNVELLHRWDAMIAEASQRFHVPQAWIQAVMRTESGGRTVSAANQPLTSAAGAMGVMQVMPGTYDEMRQQYHLGADAHDPRDNILAGTAYLRWLHHAYGNLGMFAAYNAGPGHYMDHIQHRRALPAETRAYVRRIADALKDIARDRLLAWAPRARA